MASLIIDRRRPTDEREIDRLYRAVFGATLAEGGRLRWQWQYHENPATAGQSPDIWVAREGEAILGQYAAMPVVLRWGNREVRASWGMDVFVLSEARGQGVGAQLFTTWADSVEVALGLGLTPSSYGLFQKLRFEDVGPVPFFRSWLDPVAVASRRLGRPLGRVVGGLMRAGLAVLRRRPEAGSVAVRPIRAFGREHDDLWRRTGPSYAMCVRRDAAYLNWKYVRCPHRKYDLWEARRGDEVVGFGVSRHEDYRGLRLGWIVDAYAAEPDGEARRALIAAVLESFRGAGVARAQAFALGRALARDLRRLGFFRGSSPMQFCLRAHGGLPEACRDSGRWHVVFGDSDMDR